MDCRFRADRGRSGCPAQWRTINEQIQRQIADLVDPIDAAVVERAGGRIVLTPGDQRLLKLTYPEDFAMAELLAGGAQNTNLATRIGQGFAAGVLANGIAALFTTALGTATIALMLRSSWLLRWLNHGHQLTAIAAYRYESTAAGGPTVYMFMLIWFPVIGLLMSALGVLCTLLGRPAPEELPPVPATPR